MAKLRVGLIGAGGIGRCRAQHYSDDPDAELVLCASRTAEKARAIAEQHGCRVVETWQELVQSPEIDAVSIAAPNLLHYEQARAALSSGKHTSVEYPLCQTLEDVDELYELARRKGVALHHGLNVREEPLYTKTKQLLPDLGDIAHARITFFAGGDKWYHVPELVGNMHLALHLHFVDYFRGFFGDVRSLLATYHRSGRGEDSRHSGTILMEHERNPAGYIEFGAGYPGRPAYTMSILGAKGYLYAHERQISLDCGAGPKDVEMPSDEALREDSNNFVAQVVRNAPPLRTPEDGRRTMEISLLCTKSAATGEKITL